MGEQKACIAVWDNFLWGGGGLKGFTRVTFSVFFSSKEHVFAGEKNPRGLADPPHKFDALLTCTMTLNCL